jgi:hypothetical protein
MDTFELSFQQMDPEAKWGMTGQKYTAVNNLWSLLHGILFTAIFYGLLWPLHNLQRYPYIDMFFHGGRGQSLDNSILHHAVDLLVLGYSMDQMAKVESARKSLDNSIDPR